MECQTGLEAYLEQVAFESALQKESRHQAQQTLISDVRREIDRLPLQMMFENYDMPTFQPVAYAPIRVFYLGEFNYAWADRLSGRTSLYVSRNGELYEYGPLHHRPAEDDNNDVTRTRDNPVALRLLDLQSLDIWELVEARHLLRRLWI